jgi:hypothetical protein
LTTRVKVAVLTSPDELVPVMVIGVPIVGDASEVAVKVIDEEQDGLQLVLLKVEAVT